MALAVQRHPARRCARPAIGPSRMGVVNMTTLLYRDNITIMARAGGAVPMGGTAQAGAGGRTRAVRSVPAVTRAVAILRLLGASEEPLGVNAIARALELVPSTCLHILRVLAGE